MSLFGGNMQKVAGLHVRTKRERRPTARREFRGEHKRTWRGGKTCSRERANPGEASIRDGAFVIILRNGLFFFWGVWLCDHFDVFEKMSRKLGTLGFVTFLTALVYYWELNREALIYGYDSRQYFMLAGLLFQFFAANFVLALLYRMDQKGVSGKVSGYLVRSGKDVYGIYMAHLIFLACLIALWKAVGLPDVYWVKVAVVAVSTWVVAQSLVRVCRRPGLSLFNRFLFGARV